MNSQVLTIDDSPTPTRLFWQGTVAMLPLSIAVLPWGLLAGSFAIEAGLSVVESQALSAVLYAGAAQLVAIGMFKTGAGLLSLLIATFFYYLTPFSVQRIDAQQNQPITLALAADTRLFAHR